ncbi:alpha/beta hydrolase [Candidatus Microgenomates bacterium]|nr:alpha/beta hydrolase [Candidatus Microgenomates bacterium]
MRETFKNIISENLASLLSKIKTPCLLLWGEKDKMVPVTIAQKIYDRIPKTDLIVISNASHKLPYENPKLFSKKCLEFLDNFKK